MTGTLAPFLWLAAVAFVIGFLGYVAFGRPTPAVAREEAATASASAPQSAMWNLPKHI